MRGGASAPLALAAAAGAAAQCPTGSLDGCIAACPASPVAVYEACVTSCGKRCGGAPPAPAPGPVPPPPAPPAPAPAPSPSPSGLDAYIQKQMSAGKIPGLSAAVLKNDQILWAGQYGSAQPSSSSGPAVNNRTVFMLASLSKTVIGMSAMKLYDMGLINPDDDVNKYLPFKLENPHFASTPITFHMLLTHTSSISDNKYDDIAGGSIYFEGDPGMSMANFYKAMFTTSGKWYSKQSFANKKPGTHFDYTNIGAALAGYVIELVAQKHGLAQSYDQFARENVFAPLGVSNEGYLVSDFGGEAKLAPPAGAIPSDSKRAGGFKSYCFYNFPDYPDGAMKISALDYAKMFGAYINGGNFQGTQLLNASTVSYMKKKAGAPCKPQPCGDDLPQSNAFFYYETQAGRKMLGHNGAEMGIATEAFYNTATGVGYVVLTNGDWGNSDSDKFSKAFSAIEEKLLSTFDAKGDAEGAAPRGPRRIARRRRAPPAADLRAEAGCPCGTPCNG